MKKLLSFVLVLLLTACARPPSAPLNSPSGKFTVATVISGNDAGPTLRLCVKLIVREVATGKELVFQTSASNVHKWALGWTQADVLVLYSSDIGIRAYDLKDGAIVERQADNAEQTIGRQAYQSKYGYLPRN